MIKINPILNSICHYICDWKQMSWLSQITMTQESSTYVPDIFSALEIIIKRPSIFYMWKRNDHKKRMTVICQFYCRDGKISKDKILVLFRALSVPDWSWMFYIYKNDLEILILPPQSSKCWDHILMSVCPVHPMLGIVLRTLHMLGKNSTNWAIWTSLDFKPILNTKESMVGELFVFGIDIPGSNKKGKCMCLLICSYLL